MWQLTVTQTNLRVNLTVYFFMWSSFFSEAPEDRYIGSRTCPWGEGISCFYWLPIQSPCLGLFYILTEFNINLKILIKEGGVKVCSIAVLAYFWCGFAVIFILTCSISVLLDDTGYGLQELLAAVIGKKNYLRSYNFFLSSPSLIYLFFQRISFHSQGLPVLLHKQALWFVIMSFILVG